MPRDPRLHVARLVDPAAERVRASHHKAIEDLQRRMALVESASEAAWQWVVRTTVDSDTDSVPLLGPKQGDNGYEWRFDLHLLMSTGATKDISLTPNEATGSDLDSTSSQAGTGVTFANAWSLLQATSSDYFRTRVFFDPKTGRLRTFTAEGVAGLAGSSGVAVVGGGVWNDLTTVVQGMTLTSSVAASILEKSTIDFYRRLRGIS